jgi:ABC-type glycerol-3-phosphate transport system substrate-binding protein
VGQNANVPSAPSRFRFRARSRRWAHLVAAALMALASGLPAGAEPARATAPGPCAGPARPGARVVLWHPFVDHDVHRRALDDGLRAFRATHPQVTVDAVPVEIEKLAARLGVVPPRDAPDILLAPNGDLARLADSGRTLAAEPCLRALGGPRPDRFWPAIRRAWTTQGRLWAVPYAASVPLLWFNSGRLAAAGQTVPATGAQLDAALRAVGARTGRPAMRYDLELAFVVAERWSAQRGTPLVDRDADGHPRVHLDRAGVRDALVWLRNLDRDGIIASFGGDASADDVSALMVPTESAALAVETSATTGAARQLVEEAKLDLALGGLAPMPPPDAARAPEPAPDGLGFVLVDGPGTDPRTAATLAAFLAEPGPQAAMAAMSGYVPTVRGAPDEPVLADVLRRFPPMRVAIDALTTATPPPDDGRDPVRPGTHGELRTTVIDAYRRLLRGGDPEAVLADSQRTAQRQLDLYERAHGR